MIVKAQHQLHKRSAVSVCIAAALGIGSSGFAQAQETAAEKDKTEVIDVTGSRIPTDPNVISSVPVQSVDSKDIKMSGELNLADVVADIPALVSSLTAENSTTGANSLNLRGLGGERTLTLVNGRRHVAGFRGTSAVDVGTIPRALVERVEVTTGGASAVYGADAVTGVVNFILKDDYEGVSFDFQAGLPEESGGDNWGFDLLIGENFDNDKGNITFAFTYEREQDLRYGDRDWSKDGAFYTSVPSGDPNLPSRILVQDAGYWLSSQQGSIAPTFGGRNTVYIDANGNGIADCQESLGGQIGYLAGCWVTDPDGSIRVYEDEMLYGNIFASGGDASRFDFNEDTLMPSTDKAVFNLNGNYDVTGDMNAYFEVKYVNAESDTYVDYDTYYDTLFIPADNPFIPEQLDPVVAVTGGLLVTQDPINWVEDPTVYTRETFRIVSGFEWDVSDDHTLDFSINHGVFKNKTESSEPYLDRVFAAIDAVEGPDGNPVCRSDLDPTAAYAIDYFTALNGYGGGAFSSDGYYSFTPGDGQCAPLNVFGTDAISPEAQAFIKASLVDHLKIEQTVVSLISTGEFSVMDGFLDDTVGYSAGIEFREEKSRFEYDSKTLGILPEGTSYTPGVDIQTVSPGVNSYISIDNIEYFNSGGGYDVWDAFAEVRLPILMDREFAHELTFDAALRVSDYSTLGNTTSWKLGLAYSPIEDLSFRATLSQAVRAPNISELFDPRIPITINASADPCDPANIADGSASRQANCQADLEAAGVATSDIVDANGNYIWSNPLTARFAGAEGGNPDLDVETADTFTFGIVYRSSVIDGLVLTLDYWDIEIDDAIAAVDGEDILDGCFDSANYPNLNYCSLFSRRSDGGLNDLQTGQINYARQEAEGYDISASYEFDVGTNRFGVTLVGSQQDKLNNYFNPLDLNEVDIGLGELYVPEKTGNIELTWENGPIGIAYQITYQSEQSVGEIEDLDLWGGAGLFDEVYIHDINASYQFDDSLRVYGGINNLADEEPFKTQTAWPVGPRGRMLFLGVSYSM